MAVNAALLTIFSYDETLGTFTCALAAPSITCSPTISSGASAPGSTPTKVGNIYIDTVAKKLYFAAATSSSSDWIIAN
jgi:hypothetical protein